MKSEMGEEIRADLKCSFGLHADSATPVPGGWLNRKWKLVCDGKAWLVKQYSRKRFNQKQLDWTEQSMQRQLIAKKEGVPCPCPLSFQGKVLRSLPDGTVYMVMEFCPGVMLDHNTITTDQMYSLGKACGQIHRTFSALPPQGVRAYPLDRKAALRELWEHYRTQMAECEKAAEKGGHAGPPDFSDSSEGLSAEVSQESFTEISPGYFPEVFPEFFPELFRALERERRILEQLPADFFDRMETGIGHEDFTPDNMLFSGNEVSAILDFDRSQYGYRLHDVGRAILSFALKDGELDRKKAYAFLEGYGEWMAFGRSGGTGTKAGGTAGTSAGAGRSSDWLERTLSDALMLTWCLEAPRWVKKGVFAGASVKPARFLEEILWVGEEIIF